MIKPAIDLRPRHGRPGRWALRGACGALCLALLGAADAAAVPTPLAAVAWQAAAEAADIERAFAIARAGGKPVLLYWGASWCPPCNQLKATLFNRQDFAALSRSFVAVHVDGDRPGAQRLGERFKVRGYPTLVLLKADGSEITRLPGEAEPEQVLQLLRLGLAGGRSAAAVLADARAGRAVSADEWRLLAFYSWETDDEQLLGRRTAADALAELAPASTPAGAETSARLWLKALAASDDGQGIRADEAVRDRVRKLLADPALMRALADVVVNSAPEIVRTLADRPEQRQPFVASFDAALRRLEADRTLSRGDRVSALISRIELARIELPKGELKPDLPQPLLQEVRAHASAADAEITDPYERQAVIPSAAHALERAGLWAESESLLLANLQRSRWPYYLMSQLGSLCRKLGRTDDALRWYALSFDKSQGPATRLQWGAGYLQALVEMAGADSRRIEATAAKLFEEASRDSGAFDKRSARSLERAARALNAWNRGGGHAASLKRLQARLDSVCARVEPSQGRRDRCRSLLAGPPKPAG